MMYDSSVSLSFFLGLSTEEALSEQILVKRRFLGVFFFGLLIPTLFLPLAVCKYKLPLNKVSNEVKWPYYREIFYNVDRLGVFLVVAGYKGN